MPTVQSGVNESAANQWIVTDALSRKTGMIDPDMGKWKYDYDLASNLITQTDALNNTLWFKYDALNRLIEKRQHGLGV
jgi:YD repeat-containing protein